MLHIYVHMNILCKFTKPYSVHLELSAACGLPLTRPSVCCVHQRWPLVQLQSEGLQHTNLSLRLPDNGIRLGVVPGLQHALQVGASRSGAGA
jgi:hypothetical protein